jgi:5-methylcytosine-specific restriction endonuclease McrA
MNQHGIPPHIEAAIRARDVACVYCHKVMVPTTSARRADWATIEHLDHLPPFRYREGQTEGDFAIACMSCNSRRRDKPSNAFVAEQGISETVAPVVRAYLKREKLR